MKIILKYSDKIWREEFLEMHKKLLDVLKNVEIQHIGSTAVTGLIAKPIVDILIGIKSPIKLNDTIKPIKKLGFEYISKYENKLPNRRFFIKKASPPAFHVHVVCKKSYWFKRHIAFRDELRKNKKTRGEYELLKIRLAKKEWKEANDYADAKTDFIRNVENRILNENKENYT